TSTALGNFVAESRIDLAGLAAHLDGMSDAARADFIATISARQQAQLYEAAAGFRPLTLADFVPAPLPPLTPVIHSGKNSLAMFTRFEKRFCRAPNRTDQLWGY